MSRARRRGGSRQSRLPRPATRLLAGVGILGGLGLLAAFVLDIPPAVNSLRILLFYAGIIAIVVAAHPWQAAASRRLALAGAAPLVLATAWSLGWFLLGLGRERPFAGDFGLVGFYAGLALWLSQAWFGLVALRIRVLWRPATLVLAVGSLLAITGIDRLGLTSGANPTIFGPISLLGIALCGTAWVLLGIDLLVLDRGGQRQAAGAPDPTGEPLPVADPGGVARA